MSNRCLWKKKDGRKNGVEVLPEMGSSATFGESGWEEESKGQVVCGRTPPVEDAFFAELGVVRTSDERSEAAMADA